MVQEVMRIGLEPRSVGSGICGPLSPIRCAFESNLSTDSPSGWVTGW